MLRLRFLLSDNVLLVVCRALKRARILFWNYGRQIRWWYWFGSYNRLNRCLMMQMVRFEPICCP
jgi:hypothetical protein